MNTQELRNALSQFTGTEQYYRHPLATKIKYTDGVRFFAENAGGGAYWFLDILATEPAILKQQQEFASIMLRAEDGKGLITVTDGNENPPAFVRKIEFTDCPDGEWPFFMIDNVILLRSEY